MISNYENKFDDILSELQSDIGSYTVYEPDHRNVWVETTFDAVKSKVLHLAKAGEWHASIEHQIDESAKAIYFLQPQYGRMWGKTKWSEIEHQSTRDTKDTIVSENIKKYYASK